MSIAAPGAGLHYRQRGQQDSGVLCASGMRGGLRGRLMPVIGERFEVKVGEKDEAQAKPE